MPEPAAPSSGGMLRSRLGAAAVEAGFVGLTLLVAALTGDPRWVPLSTAAGAVFWCWSRAGRLKILLVDRPGRALALGLVSLALICGVHALAFVAGSALRNLMMGLA